VPSTPRVGQTRHAIKVPRIAPATDADHNANMRHLEQAINDLPIYAGRTATSVADEVTFAAGSAETTVPVPADQIADSLGALYVQVKSVDAAGPAFAYLGDSAPIGFVLHDDGAGDYSGALAVPWYIVEDLTVTVDVVSATTGTLAVMYVYAI